MGQATMHQWQGRSSPVHLCGPVEDRAMHCSRSASMSVHIAHELQSEALGAMTPNYMLIQVVTQRSIR